MTLGVVLQQVMRPLHALRCLGWFSMVCLIWFKMIGHRPSTLIAHCEKILPPPHLFIARPLIALESVIGQTLIAIILAIVTQAPHNL